MAAAFAIVLPVAESKAEIGRKSKG